MLNEKDILATMLFQNLKIHLFYDRDFSPTRGQKYEIVELLNCTKYFDMVIRKK